MSADNGALIKIWHMNFKVSSLLYEANGSLTPGSKNSLCYYSGRQTQAYSLDLQIRIHFASSPEKFDNEMLSYFHLLLKIQPL